MIKKEDVLSKLSNVLDPDIKKDLVTLNMIKNLKIDNNEISFDIELTTPACPLKEKIKKDCLDQLQKLGKEIIFKINFTSNVIPFDKKSMVKNIKNIIAITSGKGGVGKSTISSNVAVGLSKMGAKVGLIAPDKITLDYVREKSFLDSQTLEKAEDYWLKLKTDEGASFDNEIIIDISKIKPQVTWGTSPEMVVNFDAEIPTSSNSSDNNKKNIELARDYMGIDKASKLSDLVFDKVFIGSCTNSRIEDLRQAAEIIKGRSVADNILEAIVVPGSGQVKEQAENEGLDKVFKEAGFIWRDPGCSMCLGMNPDQLKPYERCASTSNRNFEGRQGYLGRTHLMSPLMAAYTAINGTVGEPS